ncbi:MAG TPA: hypothetical protein VJS44_19730 [Pyrinomonadaceae bacterium]|nr:hypothetical protein [Pyrinomonadaceae bacterium]
MMQFSFEVGFHEKHVVMVNYNQMIGVLSIFVDDREVIREQRTFSLSLVRKYELTVGEAERHTVRIEKKRKLLLAGLRPQKFSVFVDGQLIREYEGM